MHPNSKIILAGLIFAWDFLKVCALRIQDKRFPVPIAAHRTHSKRQRQIVIDTHLNVFPYLIAVATSAAGPANSRRNAFTRFQVPRTGVVFRCIHC